MKYVLVMVLPLLFLSCKSASVAKENKKNDPASWVDDNTLQIRASGLVPYPPRDYTTNKILSCQNARTSAIELFRKRFMKDEDSEPSYRGRKYSRQFHSFKIDISTIEKEHDDKGNCRVLLQFKGDKLRQKLTASGMDEN